MRPVRSWLRGTSVPLYERHDVAMLDLDGVVYVGREAVPGVPEALAAVAGRGLRLAYVTNNAARPPQAVVEHLAELGVEASPDEVITSAQAAARYLADRLDAGAEVLVVGTTGLVDALSERGLTPVWEAGDGVVAVVQGYSPDIDWRMLAEGAVAIRRGVPWVATNVDPTVPSPRGPLPGNGSLVAALRCATKTDPVVTGKPDPTMHRETLLRTEAKRPIVVGDRLDTDIEGANAVGCPSMLVFSGVTSAAELLAAPPKLRPTYLAADLSGLLDVHPAPVPHDAGSSCGRWSATWADGGLELRADDSGTTARGGGGSAGTRPADNTTAEGIVANARLDADALDALRALCAAYWARPDSDAREADRKGAVRASGSGAARDVLARLGLDPVR